MRLNQNKIFFIILLTCCTLFFGCQNASPDSHADRSSAADEQKETAAPSFVPAAGTEAEEPKPDDYKICFIGNSLIDFGNQARYLDDIALTYGRQVSVDQITCGGAFLRDYIKETFMSKKEVKEKLEKADIVVFQDYGGWQGKETIQSITKLEKWCREDAMFYYYMYDQDDSEMVSSDYRQLRELGIQFIPKGQMIDALLYEMSYSYEALHLKNDFHPNGFNGYVAALVMHGVIFDEKCTDFPKDWFFGDKTAQLTASLKPVTDNLHGDSEQEKWEEFQRICQKADELILQAESLSEP